MVSETHQTIAWTGEFGRLYTKRNLRTLEDRDKRYEELIGIPRSQLNKEFLSHVDRTLRILEVGTNVGDQLLFLKNMGFKELYGVEIQHDAIRIAQNRDSLLNLITASGFHLPFQDHSFDLVFTTVVLIHIDPQHIKKCMAEIYRCSRKYIWGYEYYYDHYVEVEYRNNKNLLWKTDFCQLYLDLFPDLRLVKKKKLPNQNSTNIDCMFLLEKK